ncbi:M protein, serotype 12 family protein [Streptococcus ictaluri 707-05]|uniref:M protein, serotype 12 family protein n=1 Tax=Streptococcus ictaluri 707-05 TaxID=764299 RepID=G5JZP3_9STRE|nr:YSIRK-type signal peptide-containing protein [Streptococcus ictaluri]EHI70952.1 M protein, serotype 12 family protein [Streptococcus ictaluri 707-05]
MTRENTNKHYSLRKLKKGTTSVAVALCVLGAGLASQTEVRADSVVREVSLEQATDDPDTNTNTITEEAYRALEETLLGVLRDHSILFEEKQKELNDLSSELELKNRKIAELANENDELIDEIERYSDVIQQANREASARQKELNDLSSELELKQKELDDLSSELELKFRRVAELEDKNNKLIDEIGKYADVIEQANFEASARQEELAIVQLQLEAKNAELEAKNAEIESLKVQGNMKAEEIAKLESEVDILEIARHDLNLDIAVLQAKLNEANADKAKLTEEKQVLEASRERTNSDLEAAREAKKQVDAELAIAQRQLEAREVSLEQATDDPATNTITEEAYRALEETLLGVLRDHSILFEEKQKELNDLSSELELKNRKIAELANENDELIDEIERYSDVIQQANREASARQKELNDLSSELELKNRKIRRTSK